MSKQISPEIIKRIKQLREKGWSLNEIKKEVNIGYGTIYRYIKDVKILSNYQSTWFGKRGGSKKRKIFAEKAASSKAKETITSLNNKEKLLLLTSLYWGEGSKKDLGLSNTDPQLIKIFTKGLLEIFGISKDRLRVSIRIYEDLDKEQCLDFWSKIVGIKKEKFINVNILKGKKKGKLPYGMCRVRVEKGGDVLKYIKALREEIIRQFSYPHSSTDRAQVS